MSIHPLEGDVVKQLCSNQIIADLASIIKELIDNSIDAGSTSIEIRLDSFGLHSITVEDNGCGIPITNHQYLLKPHHTSKIDTFADIYTLSTLGFRGEALSALAAIADISICTKTAQDTIGTVLHFDQNCNIINTDVSARTNGTTIILHTPFFNIPVRRAAITNHIQTEQEGIIEIVQNYALSYPTIKFHVSNYDPNTKRWDKLIDIMPIPITTTNQPSSLLHAARTFNSYLMRNSITQLFPQELTKLEYVSIFLDLKNPSDIKHFDPIMNNKNNDSSLSKTKSMRYNSSTQISNNTQTTNDSLLNTTKMNVDYTKINFQHTIEISGYISKLEQKCGRSLADRQFLFLNGRPIDHPLLLKTISKVYKQFSVKGGVYNNSGTFPMIFLNLQTSIPFDINVTPNKRKVMLCHDYLICKRVHEVLTRRYQGLDQNVPLTPTTTTGDDIVLPTTTIGIFAKSKSKQPTLQSFLSKLPSSNSNMNINPHRTTNTTTMIDIDSQELPQLQSRDPQPLPPQFVAKIQQQEQIKQEQLKQEQLLLSQQQQQHDALLSQDEQLLSQVGVQSSIQRQSSLSHPLKQELQQPPVQQPLKQELQSSRQQSIKQELQQPSSKKQQQLSKSKTNQQQLNDATIIQPKPPSIIQSPPPILLSMLLDQPFPSIFDHAHQQIRQHMQHKLTTELLKKDQERLQQKVEKRKQRFKLSSTTSTDTNKDIFSIEETSRLIDHTDFEQMYIIGQFNKGFILVRLTTYDEDDIYMIDQHACDEKYNYEHLLTKARLSQQPLMVPKPIHLQVPHVLFVVDHINLLKMMGFHLQLQYDSKSTSTVPIQRPTKMELLSSTIHIASSLPKVLLSSLPSYYKLIFDQQDLSDLCEQLIELSPEMISYIEKNLITDESLITPTTIISPLETTQPIMNPMLSFFHLGNCSGVHLQRLDTAIASRSCRMSIMIGDPLTRHDMETQVLKLVNLDSPWSCPHGRPTIRHVIDLE